jgi:hypothetical protein
MANRRKKNALPFDKKGGTVVIQRRLLTSSAYLRLGAPAKVLMMLMQRHWSPNGPVSFGVRQAESEIPCSRKSAMQAFRDLQEAGFIVLVDESLFCSRTQSKNQNLEAHMDAMLAKPSTNERLGEKFDFNRCKNDTCRHVSGVVFTPLRANRCATGVVFDTCTRLFRASEVSFLHHTYITTPIRF